MILRLFVIVTVLCPVWQYKPADAEVGAIHWAIDIPEDGSLISFKLVQPAFATLVH